MSRMNIREERLGMETDVDEEIGMDSIQSISSWRHRFTLLPILILRSIDPAIDCITWTRRQRREAARPLRGNLGSISDRARPSILEVSPTSTVDCDCFSSSTTSLPGLEDRQDGDRGEV